MARVKGAISKGRKVEAEVLREALKPVYEKLSNCGVKDEDLPSPEYLAGKLLGMMSEDAVNTFAATFKTWVDKKP